MDFGKALKAVQAKEIDLKEEDVLNVYLWGSRFFHHFFQTFETEIELINAF